MLKYITHKLRIFFGMQAVGTWLLLLPATLFPQNRLIFIPGHESPVNNNLLQLQQNINADITITKAPAGFFMEGDGNKTRLVKWQPANLQCVLRYDSTPGNRDLQNNYPNQFNASGTGELAINAFNEGLNAGVYYCILVAKNDLSQTSVEFKIIVQASVAARPVSPLGAISLQQGSPMFRWDQVVGVPYYYVFLSEGPIAIKRNDEGKISGLSGLNLIWQVITAETFIKYGEPDPGGNFINTNVPPLLPGIEYNWVVLNCYGPGPNLISSDVAPVAPSFFEVTRPTLPQIPALISPRAGALLINNDIEFAWTPVNGATRYLFILYEEAKYRGNTIRFAAWKQITGDANLHLNAGNLLVKADYKWRVVAEQGNQISTSELRGFTYDGAAGWVTFNVNSPEGPLSRVNIDIRNAVDGPTLLPAVTDSLGKVKNLPFVAGNYNFTAAKSGFQTTPPASFSIQSGQTTSISFEMKRGAATVSGQVLDENGTGVFNALVEAKSGATIEKLRTDENGYFTFTLNPGNWILQARKIDFVQTENRTVFLQKEEVIDVGQFILVAATNSVSGLVLFAEDRRPLQGTTLRADNGEFIYETTSGNQGGYRFNLGPGKWRISVDSQGFFTAPVEYFFQFSGNQQAQASFQLFIGALVYGSVRFANVALDGAEVKASDPVTGQLVQISHTNVQGRYSMGLPQGNYELTASHKNFLDFDTAISVNTGETLVQDFTLTESGFVQGKVFNLDTGMPEAGVKVFALEDTTLQTITDSDGLYLLSLPPNIPFQINALLPGYSSNGPISVITSAGEIISGRDFFLQALSGIIRVQVTDGTDGLPGATVAIDGKVQDELTDANGRIEIETETGAHLIEARLECHLSNSKLVNLAEGDILNLLIVLAPLRSEITGRVIDSAGIPIVDAAVRASGDSVFSVLSDVNGDYEICVDKGIFSIMATKSGYFPADTIIVVNEGDRHIGVNFTLLESFATLSGIVTDKNSNPVAMATVQLINDTQTITAPTGIDGSYEIKRIVPGEASVRALRQGDYGGRSKIFLNDLAEARLNLTLYPANGFINGQVLDSIDSTGINRVTVSTQFSIDPEVFVTTQTDRQGLYSLNDLPVVANSTYQVFAFKEDYILPAAAVNVLPGTSGLDFFLVRKNGTIPGLVRDLDTTAPIANARIEALNHSGSRSIAFSDTAGMFTLVNLAPTEDYSLSVTVTGYFSAVKENIAARDSAVTIDLLRKYGFVQGLVTDFQTRQPLPNIPVNASPLGLKGRPQQVVTDGNGNYLLELVPDFYEIKPLFSHHRSVPNFIQREVVELDTSDNFDFTLEPQTTTAISIQRADQTERPTISNAKQHCYVATALDPENRPVNIGMPQWSLNVSSQAATIDQFGCVTPDERYFGDLTIKAQDSRDGISGKLEVQVFARIDSLTAKTFFDDRGLEITIVRNSVLSGKNLLVSKAPLSPAKKNRSRYLTTNYSFTIKPANLVFNKQVKLMLPPPDNTTGQERFIARWNKITSQWDLQASTDLGSAIRASIAETGEYVALAMSKPLDVNQLTLLPNPFSPFMETDGLPGLKIQFDLSSGTAPNPLLTVKIYNLEGNLVRLLHDQTPFPRGKTTVNWDGKTDTGALARNGRYLVRVIAEDPTDKRDEMKSVVLIK